MSEILSRSGRVMEVRANGFIDKLYDARVTISKHKETIKSLKKSKEQLELDSMKKIDDLNEAHMEIFFLRFNPEKLKDLMHQINQSLFHCKCVACYETGRSNEMSRSHLNGVYCSFARNWENILSAYNITFEYKCTDDADVDSLMSDITDPLMGPRIPKAPTYIINLGKDDLWRNVAYGKPLTRRDFNPFSEPRERLRYLFCILDDVKEAPVDASDSETESVASEVFSSSAVANNVECVPHAGMGGAGRG